MGASMKKIVIVFVLSFLMFMQTTYASKGVVVFVKNSHYVIETNMGYSVMEWFGGSDPYEGDTIGGDIDSFGFKDLYNITRDNNFRVYIDNYYLSKSSAQEWVSNHIN